MAHIYCVLSTSELASLILTAALWTMGSLGPSLTAETKAYKEHE